MGNYPVIDPVATGINIDGMRRAAGYSVAAMAEYFGFATTNAIYKWIHGTSMPTLDNVMALSMLFGVSVNDIVVMKKKG